MKKEDIKQRILDNCPSHEHITKTKLWDLCGRPRKNNFWNVLKEGIEEKWLEENKDGIIKTKFSKTQLSSAINNEWIETVLEEDLSILSKEKIRFTKKGIPAKKTKNNLESFFHQIDHSILTLLVRNFLAYRLKLISPMTYHDNQKKMGKRFDAFYYGLIDDHRIHQKQIKETYLNFIHNIPQFKV